MVPARRELPERPLLRVPVASLRSGEMALDEATSRYVVRVHRLRSGAEFLAFDPEAALEGRARIASDRLPNASILVDTGAPPRCSAGGRSACCRGGGRGTRRGRGWGAPRWSGGGVGWWWRRGGGAA